MMRADLLIAGKYRLVRELGSGAMGVVWLARNELVDREFAIKFLHPATPRGEEVLARFFQEAKILGRLRHPSLLEIVDVGKAAELHDAPYLVMELLEGIPLDGAIRAMGRIPLVLTLLVMQEITRGLSLAHEKGIVHRDLKPANIFLHRSGSGVLVPKVVDFGISKIIGAPGSEPGLSLTRTGALMGSPLYMSPEQAASDKTIDARSDVHALGVVMWECLVGTPPYAAQTFSTLIIEIVTTKRPLLREVMPEAPASLEALLTKAFARDREERFPSALELAAAIEREIAALGGTHTLDQRTSAELFFSKVPEAASPEAVAAPAPYVSKRKRTHTDSTQLAPALEAAPAASFPAHPAPVEIVALAPKRSLVPYAIIGAVVLVAGTEWYLAGRRAAAEAEAMQTEVVVDAAVAPLPLLPPEPSVVFDAGSKTVVVSPRPTKLPPRPS
ncbi:MAG: serine/threonine-protein kinase, partial [Polyangiaceae bacterium]